MKHLFSSFVLGLLATSVFGAPRSEAETAVLTARELSQGYRQQVILARPFPSQRATVAEAELREGVRVQESFSRFRDLRIIELDATEDLGAAIARLRATGRYEFVEPDYLRYVEAEPSDPSFSSGALWGLRNTGASNGVAGADIRAAAAWDIVTDAPGVVVAVIDTGVNINHDDLAGNIWVNPQPTFGDVNGARFLNGATSGNVADDNGHGTHVAGTIGAVGNNALGIAGVAWRVQIMPIKAFSSSGYGSDSDIVRAVNYAITQRAHIINASFGEEGGSTAASNAQRVAIAGAREAGIIVVAAAGNSALNADLTPSYPASYPLDNIVSVGASTRRDELATFSNFGSGVDLFAPGAEIVSLAHNSNTGTSTKSGTSMAAPHVAGALALLKAQFPGDNYRQLINRLLRGVNRSDRFSGKAQTGGRLNLLNALATDSNQPFNDRFADRPRLSGENLRLRASNAGATAENTEAAHAGFAPLASLWWEWTPASAGTVTLDTEGSGQDTILAVYAGAVSATSPLPTLLIGANDNNGAAVTSRLTFNAQTGVHYYIVVGSKAADGGQVFLNLNTTPANDLFSGATSLEGESARVTSFNRTATAEPGEPAILGFRGGHTLWYRWTAPRSGRFQISAVSPDFDPVLGIFTGASVTALATVAQNDNAGNSTVHTGSLCSIQATAGTTYWLLVDSKAGAENGQFTVTVVDSLWQAPTADAVTSSVAVGPNGMLYVGGTDNSIYAFNPDGASTWSARTGGFIDTSSPVVAADGSVYVGSNDGRVYAFTATGATKWTQTFGTTTPMSNSLSLAPDGTLYIKGGDGLLYALNPANGSIKWRRDIQGPATYASAAIGLDGTIYQGSDDNSLYALDPADGSVKWTFPTDNQIYTVPAIDAAGNLYFSVLNSGKLYSVTRDGEARWVYSGATLGSSSSAALSADGGTVYFGGYDGKLHAVNTANGEARWTFTLGNEVRASSPAIDASGIIYIGCYDSRLYAIRPDGTLKRTYDCGDWIRSSPTLVGTKLYLGSNDGKLYAFDIGSAAGIGPWPQYRHNASKLGRAPVAPSVTRQPASQTQAAGGSVLLTTTASSAATYQWQHNGGNVSGATSSSLAVPSLQPAQAGLYQAVVMGESTTTTEPAILGLLSPAKTLGAATEVGGDIVHPNANVYDQVRLDGPAASITADPGQVVRLSFVDLSHDIVQVEFSGAGTLSLTLDSPVGPAEPQNYVQPGVNYMKGHANIVIAGADETTNVSVFSVGRVNAVNQSLFRSEVSYDGVADIASIAILSTNGRFGGLRGGNTSFFNTHGLTGIWAPGVQFTGPVTIGDISASDSARPVLVLGSSVSTSITGGDLLQANGQSLRVSGVTSLQFVAGTTSHGGARPAQTNRARIEENGIDVTNRVVANPQP